MLSFTNIKNERFPTVWLDLAYLCQHLYPALLPLNGAHTLSADVLPSPSSFGSKVAATFPVATLPLPPHYHHCLPPWLWLPGYAAWCAGAIQGKEGRILVLAGLYLSSQTVVSNKRVIHEQTKLSSWQKQTALSPWLQSWVRQQVRLRGKQ